MEGGGEQRNGSTWGAVGRAGERSTHTHAHTCTRDASRGSLVTLGSRVAAQHPICPAQNFTCHALELPTLSSLLLRHEHIYSFRHTC